MPYIKKSQRQDLDEKINDLLEVIKEQILLYDIPYSGILNYCISTLIMGAIKNSGGIKYHQIAIVSGVLKNVSDEFYRRVAVPYEEQQIKNNGDIEVYEK